LALRGDLNRLGRFARPRRVGTAREDAMTTTPKSDSDGQQPEALASLEAAARSGSKKPDDQGLQAKPDTAPQPDSLEKEEKVAAEILKKGAERDTTGSA
jgi:hypothetical protein